MVKRALLIVLNVILAGILAWLAWFAFQGTGPVRTPSPNPSATATPTSGTVSSVKAFFMNDDLDPAITCEQVFPVQRNVVPTVASGRAALLELLKGPTAAEQAKGYITAIPNGTQLKTLTITNGTAYAGFDETLERGVGGSCRVLIIRRQITATLEQFPTVRNVVISIDGRTEDILQP